MRSPVGWVSPAVAIAATIVAIGAGSNDSIAIPAAAVAIAAAGFALWRTVRLHGPAVSPLGAPEAEVADLSDDWFDEGSMGHEAIVLMLDRIERALWHPELPTRGSLELAQLRDLPQDEFLDYVQQRLDGLEGGL